MDGSKRIVVGGCVRDVVIERRRFHDLFAFHFGFTEIVDTASDHQIFGHFDAKTCLIGEGDGFVLTLGILDAGLDA